MRRLVFVALWIGGFYTCVYSFDKSIPFNESMRVNPDSAIQYDLHQSRWKLAEELYIQHVLGRSSCSNKIRIPLIIHHIWVGSQLPEYAVRFRESWIKYNPDWTFILWTDHPSKRDGAIVLKSFESLKRYLEQPKKDQFIIMDMNAVRLKNQYIYDTRAKNYGEKSDVARYEILYNIGGLYVDTDFECLKSFDDLHYCLDFYAGVAHGNNFTLYNGLIASIPKSKILKEAIEGLVERPRYADSLKYTGPLYFGDCVMKMVSGIKDRAVVFPVTFFYPWPHQFRHKSENVIACWVKPESYAIHHWKVSWLKGNTRSCSTMSLSLYD